MHVTSTKQAGSLVFCTNPPHEYNGESSAPNCAIPRRTWCGPRRWRAGGWAGHKRRRGAQIKLTKGVQDHTCIFPPAQPPTAHGTVVPAELQFRCCGRIVRVTSTKSWGRHACMSRAHSRLNPSSSAPPSERMRAKPALDPHLGRRPRFTEAIKDPLAHTPRGRSDLCPPWETMNNTQRVRRV